MSARRALGAWLVALALGSAGAACAPGAAVVRAGPADGRLTVARRGTVIAEACTLDTNQSAALASAGAHRVLREVVLLCLRVDEMGRVTPSDPDARAVLLAQVAAVRAQGYRVTLGFTLATAGGTPLRPEVITSLLLNSAWRAPVVDALASWAGAADGLEVAPPRLEDVSGARVGLILFVNDLSARVRAPGVTLGLFAPPSIRTPSDLPGGDAFDLVALAPLVDRIRVMTLDFSCCGAGPGPTLDTGWAVDAMRLARRMVNAPSPALDVSVPLYGYDFGASGERAVTFLEAVALRDTHHASESLLASGARSFTYADAAGAMRTVWFDDAQSTLLALLAWEPPTLPADEGVVYYGLGAEDPAVWDTVAGALP